MDVVGTVVYEELSGGFWGIEGDDGAQYKPIMGFPEEFKAKGQRVKAQVEPVQVMGISMWGQTVKVLKIEKA